MSAVVKAALRTNPHSCRATSAGQVPTWRWQWDFLVLCLELVTFEIGAIIFHHPQRLWAEIWAIALRLFKASGCRTGIHRWVWKAGLWGCDVRLRLAGDHNYLQELNFQFRRQGVLWVSWGRWQRAVTQWCTPGKWHLLGRWPCCSSFPADSTLKQSENPQQNTEALQAIHLGPWIYLLYSFHIALASPSSPVLS